jgi:hypothetical protein
MPEVSREKEVEAMMETVRKDAEASKQPLERRSIELKGKKEILEVFPVPLGMLRFNIRNGRFAAELLEKEGQMGRELDPNNPDDDKTIHKLLLDINPSETEYLKDDLKLKGQIDPGLITYDGYLINGNRRMAVLRELYNETEKGEYNYIYVQVLPRSLTAQDLWSIEAGLQLSRDTKLEYSPINQLLKLREGKLAGLSATQIARRFYGNVSAQTVNTDLNRLTLIEEYLTFIGKPKQYKLVEGKLEHFINAQKEIRKLEKGGLNETEMADAINVLFNLIKSPKITHVQVRGFAKQYLEKNTAMKEVITLVDKPSTEFVNVKEIPENDSENDGEDENTSTEPPTTPPLSVDAPAKVLEEKKTEQIYQTYLDAMDIGEMQKQKDQPLRLMKKAIGAIDSIDENHISQNKAEILDAISDLVTKLNALKTKLENT